jgi:hypothetical protein
MSDGSLSIREGSSPGSSKKKTDCISFSAAIHEVAYSS